MNNNLLVSNYINFKNNKNTIKQENINNGNSKIYNNVINNNEVKNNISKIKMQYELQKIENKNNKELLYDKNIIYDAVINPIIIRKNPNDSKISTIFLYLSCNPFLSFSVIL